MIFVTMPGLAEIPDFTIFTIIGLPLSLLTMVWGTFRFARSSGDPSEREIGITTILYGATAVFILLFFIELPYQLFFS